MTLCKNECYKLIFLVEANTGWFKINLSCRIKICQGLRIPGEECEEKIEWGKEKKSESWSNQANHHCHHQANPLSICITAPTTPEIVNSLQNT